MSLMVVSLGLRYCLAERVARVRSKSGGFGLLQHLLCGMCKVCFEGYELSSLLHTISLLIHEECAKSSTM